jgi:hypothetical protein
MTRRSGLKTLDALATAPSHTRLSLSAFGATRQPADQAISARLYRIRSDLSSMLVGGQYARQLCGRYGRGGGDGDGCR